MSQKQSALNSRDLRFSPTAWAKLYYLCHHGQTEIGGFGIALPEDLLFVQDFITVKQEASFVSVKFDDASVADFFDNQVEKGRKPEQFARIWLHTHPGTSASPSTTDEATFQRVFGRCDWAVMFILAKGGQTYARLRFNVGPGASMVVPMSVDYSREFPATSHDDWRKEYEQNLKAVDDFPTLSHGLVLQNEFWTGAGGTNKPAKDEEDLADWLDDIEDLQELEMLAYEQRLLEETEE